MTKLYPAFANSIAIASPIPLLDPVMTALFAFNSIWFKAQQIIKVRRGIYIYYLCL